MRSKSIMFLLILFIAAFGGYTALDRVTFIMPQDVESGAACDFTPEDFTASGQLKYSENEAWWTSFTRKEEYLSSFSVALAITFAGYALSKIRQIGAKAATGGVVGGGLIVGLAICFSCLAPVLAAVGIGLFANFGLAMAEIPKWLIAVNSLILTTYGYMYVSRKAASCPVVIRNTSTMPLED
ncbi:hypothetical protein [Paenibacillus thalictri]|uniref:hypothetical protein n=1 Tax=Paenibacillus thalictri TaxID=2527873 RepID=UPI00197DE116|nr:hypothetical protein [Paenibacillus thalictri]